jgi:pimeloyl-ACP methyl ester carboxylesterase
MIGERRARSGMLWFEAGDAAGPAVVYFHGTAGEREDLPFPDLAEQLGVRWLMAERPGYQRSAPKRGASFADIGRMVGDDLSELGVGPFSVLGYSGGGPHALACAAVAPSRVRAVGLLNSWAPMNPPDPGLSRSVRFGMRAAAVLPRAVVRLMLTAQGRGSEGMTDDICRVARPWGFDVEAVASSGRVIVWHAEGDPQVPVTPWRRVQGIELHVVDGNSHEVPRERWETALRELARDDSNR